MPRTIEVAARTENKRGSFRVMVIFLR